MYPVMTVVLFIVLLVLILLLYDRCYRAGRLMQKIPGPKPWPIVGNSIYFLLPLDKLFVHLRTLNKVYGDVTQVHAVNGRMITFYHPDYVEIILSSVQYNEKKVPYNFLTPWLGQGLLTSQGEKWQHRRKMLTPAFHFNILKKYWPTFIEQTENFLNRFQEKVGEKETNIIPLISTTTLRIMCETAMGTSTRESIESVANKYFEAIGVIGKTVVIRMCRFWLHLDLIFKWSNIAKSQEKAIKDLHRFTNKIIKERRIYLQQNNIKTFEDHESYNQKGRLAMLDLLLEKERLGAIDVDGIREEVDTFLFEGHDTAAQALSFLIMSIANETEVQEKIYEEMQDIFGSSLRMPTMEDLNKMKYLECCIKESLRLYPSVPMVLRYISEETTIGDYTIPRDSHVCVSIFDLHRREDIYPEPERFIPERFLPEACAKRHPYAYIPFSAGPRNCIGQKFAMLEMKTLVSSLIRRYRLEAVTKRSDLKFKSDIILRTVNESMYVKIYNRN